MLEIGRKITIFYDDGQTGGKKTGTITDTLNNFIELNNKIYIPYNRIYRIIKEEEDENTRIHRNNSIQQ